MKKVLLVLLVGLFWCNVAVADRPWKWKATEHDITYYLKKGWKVTFVNSFKGFKDDWTIYTLQKDSSIISCRLNTRNLLKCYEPTGKRSI